MLLDDAGSASRGEACRNGVTSRGALFGTQCTVEAENCVVAAPGDSDRRRISHEPCLRRCEHEDKDVPKHDIAVSTREEPLPAPAQLGTAATGRPDGCG